MTATTPVVPPINDLMVLMRVVMRGDCFCALFCNKGDEPACTAAESINNTTCCVGVTSTVQINLNALMYKYFLFMEEPSLAHHRHLNALDAPGPSKRGCTLPLAAGCCQRT